MAYDTNHVRIIFRDRELVMYISIDCSSQKFHANFPTVNAHPLNNTCEPKRMMTSRCYSRLDEKRPFISISCNYNFVFFL